MRTPAKVFTSVRNPSCPAVLVTSISSCPGTQTLVQVTHLPCGGDRVGFHRDQRNGYAHTLWIDVLQIHREAEAEKALGVESLGEGAPVVVEYSSRPGSAAPPAPKRAGLRSGAGTPPAIGTWSSLARARARVPRAPFRARPPRPRSCAESPGPRWPLGDCGARPRSPGRSACGRRGPLRTRARLRLRMRRLPPHAAVACRGGPPPPRSASA